MDLFEQPLQVITPKILRPYQVEAKTAVNEALAQGLTKLIIVLPTGAGKSLTATNILADYSKVLFIADREELLSQISVTFKQELGREVGIVKADKFDIDKSMTVGSMQTLWRRLDRIKPDYFDCVVFDEVHLALSRTARLPLEYFKPKLMLGLTATPYRTDNMPLTDLFDKIVYEKDIKWGIESKYLCEIDAVRIKSNLSLDNVRTTGGELNSKDLEQAVNTPERNNLIVDEWIKQASGRQTIAFCVDVQHAIDLCQVFKNKGIKAEFVVGDESIMEGNRKDTIDRFKAGTIDVLCNCMILTTGFDHREVSCVIQACPTKSKVKWMQSCGRGTRLKDGIFKDLLLLDVVDNSKRHTLVNSIELDAELPLEKKVFISEKKRQELIKRRDERKFKPQTDKNERVNLWKLPDVQVHTSVRMQEPATPAMLKWIADLGYDVVGNPYTKAMCSQIIIDQECKPWQIRDLQNWGYDVSHGTNYGKWQKAKQEHEARMAKNSTQNTLAESIAEANRNNPFIQI